MLEGTITLEDGRRVGYADYGPDDGIAVLWCHGGPGSRLEPRAIADDATAASLRMVGVDRPGYGLSTPHPGRTIGGWVSEALAVLDHLNIDRAITIGVSTGGGYALALAVASDRIIGAVACCALTDMRWAEGKAMMTQDVTGGIWRASGREEALRIAADFFGEDGSGLLTQSTTVELAPSDIATLTDQRFLEGLPESVAAMFAFGVQGYADDRIADGPGWGTFDVSAIRCPVLVMHGAADAILPVEHARHTAEIVPGADLRIFEDLGHFSIVSEVVPALSALLSRVS